MNPIKRSLLIVNPASRRGRLAEESVVRELSRSGVETTVRTTEAPGHARAIVAEFAGGADVVFTLGGDGTAMEAIDALAGHGPPVGILPGGTGNVLARSLGIPRSPARAVRRLLEGTEARVDLGVLQDGTHFIIGVGVGVDSTMILETSAALKRRLGILAYFLVGFRSALRFQLFQGRLTVDGTVYELKASAILIANFGTLLHEMMILGDGIRYDDGLLNACVFSPRNRRDLARISWRLLTRDFRPDPCLFYRAGRSFTIETTPLLAAQADGEIIGTTPLQIEVAPLAARLLLPHTRPWLSFRSGITRGRLP